MGRLTKNPHLVNNAWSATGSGLLPAGTTAQRPSGVDEGHVRYNSSNSAIEFWDGGAWEQVGQTGLVSITRDSFTGDALDTTFTMSFNVNTATDILVFIGGVYQNPTVSYTVDGSTTITFTSPPPNGETILVLHGYNEVA